MSMDAPKDEHGVHRLCDLIQDSALRIKLIVYPALFAFVILAAYGFYMVYNLTSDVRHLAVSVDINMTTMAEEMTAMSQNIAKMEQHFSSVNQKLDPITNEMAAMRQSIDRMNHAVHGMNQSTHMMQRSIGQISRPASFMSSFFPF